MHKKLGRITFMLTFYWLGLFYGLSANAESADAASAEANAINCSAAIEVMSRIAPQWSQQPDIIRARNYWDNQTIAMNAKNPKLADSQIAKAVTNYLQELQANPSEFARKAAFCAESVGAAKATG